VPPPPQPQAEPTKKVNKLNKRRPLPEIQSPLPYSPYSAGCLLCDRPLHQVPGLLLLGIVASTVSAICDLLHPIYMGSVINLVSDYAKGMDRDALMAPATEATMHHLTSLVTLIFFLVIIKTITAFAQDWADNQGGDCTKIFVQKLFFKALLESNNSYYDQTHTADLQRYFDRTNLVRQFSVRDISRFSSSFVFLVSSVIFMLRFDSTIAVGVLLLLVLEAFIDSQLSKRILKHWLSQESTDKQCNRFFVDTIHCIRTIFHVSIRQKNPV
jgi:ABC-type multidrug transport system fused ATPase/permease subunit